MRPLGIAGLLLITPIFAGCLSGAPSVTTGDAPVGGFTDTAVFPGHYDLTGPYSRPLEPGRLGIRQPEIVELASDLDGATIQMGVVRPDVPDGTRVPIIMDASPYYDAMTVQRIEENPQRDNILWWTGNHYEQYAKPFVPHGYAVVFLATRGSGDSGGCWSMFGPQEQADIDQAISWLAQQPWSNGNVGMIGPSWEGTSPWMAAATGNPHLRTIVPIVGANDLFSLIAIRNGTFSPGGAVQGAAFYTYGLGLEPASAETDPAGYAATLPGDRSWPHRAEGAACPAAAQFQAAMAWSGATLQRVDPSGFWAERDFRSRILDHYEGSVFAVLGFQDTGFMLQQYPWLRELEDRGVAVKHLLGQWGHRFPDAAVFPGQDESSKRWDYAEILLHWFDYWLKEDTTVDLGPAAQIEDSSGQWRNADTWPPRATWPVRFHLNGGGQLMREAEGPANRATLCGPTAAVGPCEMTLRFESEPLDTALRFGGLPTLHLAVTPQGPGGQLRASFAVVGPDGTRSVGGGLIDLRTADGAEAPRDVAPGRPLLARMQLQPMDVLVRPGEHLVLEVTQGPIDSMLLSGSVLPIDVDLGGDASVLTLPAFDPPAASFFRAPEPQT